MQDGSNESVKKSFNEGPSYDHKVDIETYVVDDSQVKVDSLSKMEKNTRKTMENVGIVTDEKDRAGTIMFINNKVSYCSIRSQDGLEIMPMSEAGEKYHWLKDYCWKAVNPESDEYTKRAYHDNADGYFIHVLPGYHIKDPIQSCMMIGTKKGIQTLHNVIVIENGGYLEIITGCATGSHVNEGLHISISEIYVKDDAEVVFSMVHNWGTKTAVRPRTTCILNKNARYTNNYILLEPVGTLQSNPSCFLNGKGSSCKFNTICLAQKESDIDIGGIAILNAPNASAEIISRNICNGGRIIARGRLVGNSNDTKAHLECKSIMIKDGGRTEAIPELEATVPNVEMTHEAAVGKIAREQIEYLMSRGLSESDAISMIVRGFLIGSINGLSENLRSKVDDAIKKTDLGN